MKEAIVGGVFALLGSLITFLGTYLTNRNAKREERQRQRIKSYLEEIKAFWNLEQLYSQAVADLRQKLPDEQGSKTAEGVKREFRKQNEEQGNIILSITAHDVDKMLSCFS